MDKTHPSDASWTFAEHFVPEHEAAEAARPAAEPLGVSPISQGTTALLTVLARAVQARAVVEIGTGTGVSGLALLTGMAGDGILTSIDVEPEHQAVARKAFVAAGIPTQRCRLISGGALVVLPKLSDGAYDLVFVDADKPEYPHYVEQATRLLRPGGLLVVDNMLWHDRVADPTQHDPATEAIRATLHAVRESAEFTDVLLPVGDGVLVAVRS